VVRVAEYVLDTPAGPGRERYRLVTSLLDAAAFSAEVLATTYHERWEVETALAEVKVHQWAHPRPLRSRRPREVVQEDKRGRGGGRAAGPRGRSAARRRRGRRPGGARGAGRDRQDAAAGGGARGAHGGGSSGAVRTAPVCAARRARTTQTRGGTRHSGPWRPPWRAPRAGSRSCAPASAAPDVRRGAPDATDRRSGPGRNRTRRGAPRRGATRPGGIIRVAQPPHRMDRTRRVSCYLRRRAWRRGAATARCPAPPGSSGRAAPQDGPGAVLILAGRDHLSRSPDAGRQGTAVRYPRTGVAGGTAILLRLSDHTGRCVWSTPGRLLVE
jgi:hypothetical protein